MLMPKLSKQMSIQLEQQQTKWSIIHLIYHIYHRCVLHFLSPFFAQSQWFLPQNKNCSLDQNRGYCKTQRLFFGLWTSSIRRYCLNIAVHILVQLFAICTIIQLNIKTLGYHNILSKIDQLTTTCPIG